LLFILLAYDLSLDPSKVFLEQTTTLIAHTWGLMAD